MNGKRVATVGAGVLGAAALALGPISAAEADTTSAVTTTAVSTVAVPASTTYDDWDYDDWGDDYYDDYYYDDYYYDDWDDGVLGRRLRRRGVLLLGLASSGSRLHRPGHHPGGGGSSTGEAPHRGQQLLHPVDLDALVGVDVGGEDVGLGLLASARGEELVHHLQGAHVVADHELGEEAVELAVLRLLQPVELLLGEHPGHRLAGPVPVLGRGHVLSPDVSHLRIWVISSSCVDEMRSAIRVTSRFLVRVGTSEVIRSAWPWWGIIPWKKITSAAVKGAAVAEGMAVPGSVLGGLAGSAGLDDHRRIRRGRRFVTATGESQPGDQQ